MRTPRQQVYDSFYYNFENTLNEVGRDFQTYRSFLFKRFDREFYDAYKNVIRPFWRRYNVRPGLHWIKRTYNISGSLDPRCIPRNLWYGRIIPYFNSPLYERQLQDKNLHHLLFPDVKRPETVYKHPDSDYGLDDLSPITRSEAYARCLRPGKYIIKPTTDTFEGQGIKAFSDTDGQDSIYALLDQYTEVPHIVQRFVRQHPTLAAFNESTFNTVRLITLVLDGQAYILSSILRIGAAGNCVDNVSQGGYQVKIEADGSLSPLAYTFAKDHLGMSTDTDRVQYVKATHTGARFEGTVIPSWDALCDTACREALRLPYMKLIGWDMGVDEKGDVVLIEFNARPEQNESTCGPSFGDLTERVLEEVFLRNPGHSVLRRHKPSAFTGGKTS